MPVAWMLAPYRAGELNQVRALAQGLEARLGVQVRELRLRYRPWGIWPHLFAAASLAGITRKDRARLGPPWPDLLLTSGVRNEPVARWVVRASGGRTRYVHVGKPWGPLHGFDLLVTTPQYRVPEHPKVLNNDLTLHAIDPQRLELARARWQGSLGLLPRPRLGVLVGGHSGPFTFGRRAAARLARDAGDWALRHRGALLVTTSARTPAAATVRLREALFSDPRLAGHIAFHDYSRDSGDNPYPGILALSDEFLVTGDSVGMLSELCATGKPVALFDTGGMRSQSREAAGTGDPRLGATLYRLLMRYLPQRLSRDITRVHHAVIERGLARWWDDGEAGPVRLEATPPPRRSADLERALRHITALLEQRVAAP